MATGQIQVGQVQTARLAKSVAGAVDVTLTTNETIQNQEWEFTGAITANINVILPVALLAPSQKLYVFNNTTGAFTLTVKASTGTGIAVGTAKRAILGWDGVNVVRWAADV